jgi:TonB family protein
VTEQANLLDQLIALAERLDSPLLFLWISASALLLISIAILLHRTRTVLSDTVPGVLDGERVRLSDSVGPALVGIVSYEILIPRWVSLLPGEQRKLILKHEKEHAGVFDPAITLTAVVLTALMPFNVVLWFMLRRLRTAIEIDCDRRVLGDATDVEMYASLLIDVGARVSSPPRLAAALNESASQLQQRIHAMSFIRQPAARFRAIAFAVIGIAALTAATRIPRPVNPLFTLPRSAIEDSTPVYLEWQVEEPVEEIKAPIATYPAALRSAGVEGEVVMKFIVGTDGRVEPASPQSSRATNELFRSAATAALGDALYSPAKIRGKPVRQLVEQAFMFKISSSSAGVGAGNGSGTGAGVGSGVGTRQDVPRVSDTLARLARKFEPATFDSRVTPGSSVIGLIIGSSGKVVHHRSISVPDTQFGLLPLYPRLFPDTAVALNAPYGVMMVAQRGPRVGRKVSIVGVFLKQPDYTLNRR